MTPAVRHYTALFRREQPDRPILECYWAAMSHAHFMARGTALTKAYAKRASAAKKGWKKRRAAQ